MNKLDFKSEKHKIGNYTYQFTRFDRPNLIDNFINQIDIYNDNNVKLHTLKFDTDNADLIFLAMKALYLDTEPFEYNIPVFNAIEKYTISFQIICFDNFYNHYISFIIENKALENPSFTEIHFINDEYEEFMFLFYFMFLIDLGKVY